MSIFPLTQPSSPPVRLRSILAPMTRNFIIAIFVSVAAFAQQQPSFPEDDSNGGISIELPNVELTEIILEYQKYTDEHVILDTS